MVTIEPHRSAHSTELSESASVSRCVWSARPSSRRADHCIPHVVTESMRSRHQERVAREDYAQSVNQPNHAGLRAQNTVINWGNPWRMDCRQCNELSETEWMKMHIETWIRCLLQNWRHQWNQWMTMWLTCHFSDLVCLLTVFVCLVGLSAPFGWLCAQMTEWSGHAVFKRGIALQLVNSNFKWPTNNQWHWNYSMTWHSHAQ